MACCTACRLPALTLGEPRSTSDTSDFDTPARSATVRMVAGWATAVGAAIAAPFGMTCRAALDRYIVARVA